MLDEEQFEDKLTLLDHLQSACTRCGICSEACATFQSTGWEHESPRGRIHLASQFLHGRIDPKSSALSTFDHCLGCRACEPLCPHEVRYHPIRQIVQELRRDLQMFSSCTMEPTDYQRWLTLARRIGSVWWRHYGAKWLNLPYSHFQSSGSFIKTRGKRSQNTQPILAVCCVQDLLQHDVIEQTLAFVQKLGYSLEVDGKQPCCGAIFERLVQGGDETICYPEKQQKAASLQKKACVAFMKWMPSQTYFLSQGCQCFISNQNIQTLDLYAWIESILEQQKIKLELPEPKTVYYQAYCRSKKGEQDSIFRLLRRVKGLTVHEIPHPFACCGGYCGEALLHPTHAQELARQKMAQLPPHAIVVVTSPDCWILFKNYSEKRDLRIVYPIQLLTQVIINRCA